MRSTPDSTLSDEIDQQTKVFLKTYRITHVPRGVTGLKKGLSTREFKDSQRRKGVKA